MKSPEKFLMILFLAAAALAASSSAASLTLSPSKPAYWRYEVVEWKVLSTDPQITPSKVPLLELQVNSARGPVATSAGRLRFPLRADEACGCWLGSWPIPWNPDLGEYTAEVRRPETWVDETEEEEVEEDLDPVYQGPASLEDFRLPAQGAPLATARFQVAGRQPLTLPKGFSVMTLEPGKHGFRNFKGVEGEAPHWSHIIDWAKWMHADSFWQCVGETALWRKRVADNYPWNLADLKMAAPLAALAHQQGLTYGAYMLTFIVLGDFKQADYDFTTGYVPSTGLLYKKPFVSMDDTRRHDDLVWMLKTLEATPDLDYIGLDYVRCDFGGLEFTDAFLKDMSLRLSDELEQGPFEGRQKWLGSIIVGHRDPVVEEMWQWWRSHKVGTVVRRLLDDAAVTKPVWVFSLGWKEGHQHGQDPFMLIDAGISFNAPMFYEANDRQYPAMLKSWKDYLAHGDDSLVLGQPVDGRLLGEAPGISGPEKHFQRQMEALSLLGPLTTSLGFFWHDIGRAMSGGRSHFTAREWAVAGAASFTRLREEQKVLPVRMELGGTTGTARGVSFTVTVQNVSDKPLAYFRLEGLPVRGVAAYLPATKEGGPLKPGEKVSLSWAATWGDALGRPRPRRMLAVRASLPPESSPYPAVSFTYVPYQAAPPAPPMKVALEKQ